MTPRLITIAISHYCEKARWALDRAGIAYREEGHLPLFQAWPVYRAGGESTPVLVTEDKTLTDSTDILHWVDEQVAPELRLYPSEPALRQEVEALEDEFDESFGVWGRHWMYTFTLGDPQLISKYSAMHGIPWYEYKFLPLVFPLVRSFITRSLDMAASSREQSFRAVEETMSRMARRLSDGREFLAGGRFTAADLTFAALAAPILIPENYGVTLPRVDELPVEMRRQVQRWREHPAGRFALSLIAKFRRPAAADASSRH